MKIIVASDIPGDNSFIPQPGYPAGTMKEQVCEFSKRQCLKLLDGGLGGVGVGAHQDWPGRVHFPPLITSRCYSGAGN